MRDVVERARVDPHLGAVGVDLRADAVVLVVGDRARAERRHDLRRILLRLREHERERMEERHLRRLERVALREQRRRADVAGEHVRTDAPSPSLRPNAFAIADSTSPSTSPMRSSRVRIFTTYRAPCASTLRNSSASTSFFAVAPCVAGDAIEVLAELDQRDVARRDRRETHSATCRRHRRTSARPPTPRRGCVRSPPPPHRRWPRRRRRPRAPRAARTASRKRTPTARSSEASSSERRYSARIRSFSLFFVVAAMALAVVVKSESIAIESAAMKTKVTVVGAGNVGATVAQGIALKELADVVLVDIVEGVPQGKSLDMMETAPVEKYDSILRGTNNYDGTEDSDVVVITAGLPRKPGMSRDDLLWKNEEIVGGGDARGRAALAELHHHRRLQSARRDVRSGPPRLEVPARARAGHGRRARLRAHARLHRHGAERLRREHARLRPRRPRRHDGPAAALLDRRRHPDHGAHLRRSASTPSSTARATAARRSSTCSRPRRGTRPAPSAVEMVEAILKDKRKILPCAAYLQGEYGYNGLFVGVPVKLGRNGLEQIIEIKLEDDEKAALQQSADAVQELVEKLKDSRRDVVSPAHEETRHRHRDRRHALGGARPLRS